LDLSTPNDLRNGCDRNGFCLFRGSGLLLIRLACAACVRKFAEPTFEANRVASDDCGACDTNQIVVVNPRTLQIVEIIDA
jgi:hypothetical protein